MGSTLKEILALDCFQGARVLAGIEGLQSKVNLLNVMEVPDIDNWVSENALILTTAYPFRDNPAALLPLIRHLHAKKVSGMAIKFDRFIKALPAEVIEHANQLPFPLISLPWEMKFDNTILEALSHIIQEDYTEIKSIRKISRQLEEMVLGGCSIHQIIRLLANLSQGNVVLKAPSGKIIARCLSTEAARQKLPSAGSYEKQVILDGQLYAEISLSIFHRSVERKDIELISSAIPSILMLLLQSSMAGRHKEREDILNGLLLGHLHYSPKHLAHLHSLGIDTAKGYAIVVFSVGQANEEVVGLLLDAVLQVSQTQAPSSIPPWVTTGMADCVVQVYPTGQQTLRELEAFYRRMKAEIQQQLPKTTVSIGISRWPGEAGKLDIGFQEAKKALRLGEQLCGKGEVYCYDNLVLESILSGLTPNDSELQYFIESQLGALLRYDSNKNKQLLRTLQQLLSGNSSKEIAEKLFIHRKTLAYRKAAIEKILGVSLDDISKRLQLAVAMKLFLLHYGMNPEAFLARTP